MNNESRSGQHLDDEPCIGGTGSGSDSSRAARAVAENVGSIGTRWPQTEVACHGGTASGRNLPLAGGLWRSDGEMETLGDSGMQAPLWSSFVKTLRT